MLDKTPLQLSTDFKSVLDIMEKTHDSAFVTGRAGTGKSTLLQLFRNTTKKNVVVLAPTGVAALNVKGQTIHSFFKFAPRPNFMDEIKRFKNRKIFQKLDMIIIDEISMVRADLIDGIDYFLQLQRDNDEPFGGVQMIFFGDLFQLPPVVASKEEKMIFTLDYLSPYFFSAHVFESGFEMQMFELAKIYRQDERHFIRLLDAVRTNRIDYDDLVDLNERYFPHYEVEDYYITLSTRNAIVDRINAQQLEQIDKKEYIYLSSATGKFDPRLYPSESVLRLKEGAQAMFLRNDPDKMYVNGTIGKIKTLTENSVIIEIEDNGKKKAIRVEKHTWEILKYNQRDNGKLETEVIGTFTQFPIRLAWAITIHKSQGKTFDKLIIDLGSGSFEHGQTYVALSRCRTLDGIVLKKRLTMNDIMVDERIVDFYEMNFR